MIIDCVSDLHGEYPDLEGGDLLIVAGDLTASDQIRQMDSFIDWLDEQKYTRKIVIAGNHDNLMQKRNCWTHPPRTVYLEDTGTELEYEETLTDPSTINGVRHSHKIKSKLKIWGSPWTRKFQGQNPHAMAFCLDTEEQLAEKWALIPDDIDILITHSPPLGILDTVNNRWKCGVRVGSSSLKEKVMKLQPKLHVFGHIHGSYGRTTPHLEIPTIFVNAAHMNEDYDAVNKPIRIII